MANNKKETEKDELEKTETSVEQQKEFDGSTLPPTLSGIESARPFRADINRTMYYATDTNTRYLYVDNKWEFIEKL